VAVGGRRLHGSGKASWRGVALAAGGRCRVGASAGGSARVPSERDRDAPCAPRARALSRFGKPVGLPGSATRVGPRFGGPD
jgi:hypothetical protein